MPKVMINHHHITVGEMAAALFMAISAVGVVYTALGGGVVIASWLGLLN